MSASKPKHAAYANNATVGLEYVAKVVYEATKEPQIGWGKHRK